MSAPGQQNPRQAPAPLNISGTPYFGQDFYVYQATFGTFAPNAALVQNIQIQSDSDFEWIMTTLYGNMSGATPPFLETALIPINLTLVDSGSSRQLFSGPIPAPAIAGSGKQPFILPVSRIFKAYSNLQVSAQSFDGANTYNNVGVSFIGRKLFLTNNR